MGSSDVADGKALASGEVGAAWVAVDSVFAGVHANKIKLLISSMKKENEILRPGYLFTIESC